MRKIIGLILLLGNISLCHAGVVARSKCLSTYTNSLTKCGPPPSIKNVLAYAQWAACINAALASYYACIARSYLPFDDSYFYEEVDR